MQRRSGVKLVYILSLCCFVSTILFDFTFVSQLKSNITLSHNKKQLQREIKTMPDKIPLNKLLDLPQSEFIAVIGGIYEKSPWIVQSFYNTMLSPSLGTASLRTNKDQIPNIRILFNKISKHMRDASKEKQLELLQSHPDLCLKIDAASEVTEESKHEQRQAGLSSLTSQEREEFTSLNNAYRAKFPFPFILAVKNASKQTVLSALRGRVNSTIEQELDCALFQVDKIAWMRLLDLVDAPEGGTHGGFLTCHVLDTANGIPAAGMVIELYAYANIEGEQQSRLVKSFVTNSDGRLDGPALKEQDFKVGTYEWKFYVGDYFAKFSGSRISGTPFLDVVPLKFGLDDPTEHYHVPLLVSPWSYSTYRGS